MFKNKIFIIDDDIDDIFFLTEAFIKKNCAFDIISFQDAEDVLFHLSTSRPESYPALIVTDLNMPKVSGFDLLQYLKSDKTLKYIPVVISSNSSLDNNKASCMQLGAQAYFVKPYTLDQYLQMVENMLELVRDKMEV